MASAEEKPREPRPTLAEAIEELKRELVLRENIYPKWINAGTLDMATARKQYARLRAALHYLLRLKETP